ncbi:MAG: NAD(P)H-dependent oxidoreductase subunit E [Desulfobacterales bacterium]|nr:MAG: NAD(P)H-dependent oxidoreductase subunit E [Desulfobacterales bacterium]
MNTLQEQTLLSRREQASLLAKLKEAQKEFGYVPREFMAETARALGLPIGAVYGMTTFYSFLSTRPLGKYVIRICKSIPCCMQNAAMIIDSVAAEIGITPGQNTADGRFSFELTNCIGACDMAPAMLLNDELHGHLSPGKIAEILKACK